MPIKKEEFELGKTWTSLEGQIVAFLRANRSTAYTATEILQALGYKTEIKDFGGFIGFVAGSWVIQQTLDSLVKEGHLKARQVKTGIVEQVYYMAK